MKIAITAKGKDLDAPVDPRFGRAEGFIIFDDESNEFEYIDNNQNLNAVQGAGIQASKNVIDRGVAVLVSGDVGPKAFGVLNSADIQVYSGASGKVSDALEDFKSGKLKKADEATVEAHH